MNRERQAALYESGIDLFNAGQFFECHEEWEQLWLRAEGDEKRFYQGLIQAAVAILHAQRGNLEGARKLYRKASSKLDPMPDEHMGIALGSFRKALRKFIEAVLGDDRTCTPPAPQLRRIGSSREYT